MNLIILPPTFAPVIRKMIHIILATLISFSAANLQAAHRGPTQGLLSAPALAPSAPVAEEWVLALPEGAVEETISEGGAPPSLFGKIEENGPRIPGSALASNLHRQLTYFPSAIAYLTNPSPLFLTRRIFLRVECFRL